MEPITEALKQLNILDVSLYGIAFVLALLLRFMRAAWLHVGGPHTILAAGGMGAVGAILTLTSSPHPWQFVATQGIALTAAVLVVEGVLRKLADKVPWLPTDNQYVDPERMPDAPHKEDK